MVEAAPLTARKAPSINVSDSSAQAIQSRPMAAASVMVANGKLRARPGYSLYVGDGGNAGIIVKDEEDTEPGRWAAETVLIRDWKFAGGVRYLVWMSCSCTGVSDDNCAFARDGSGNMNLNECLGMDCCGITTMVLNDTTGSWEKF